LSRLFQESLPAESTFILILLFHTRSNPHRVLKNTYTFLESFSVQKEMGPADTKTYAKKSPKKTVLKGKREIHTGTM
jgi:hypothetical protein